MAAQSTYTYFFAALQIHKVVIGRIRQQHALIPAHRGWLPNRHGQVRFSILINRKTTKRRTISACGSRLVEAANKSAFALHVIQAMPTMQSPPRRVGWLRRVGERQGAGMRGPGAGTRARTLWPTACLTCGSARERICAGSRWSVHSVDFWPSRVQGFCTRIASRMARGCTAMRSHRGGGSGGEARRLAVSGRGALARMDEDQASRRRAAAEVHPVITSQ